MLINIHGEMYLNTAYLNCSSNKGLLCVSLVTEWLQKTNDATKQASRDLKLHKSRSVFNFRILRWTSCVLRTHRSVTRK